MGRLINGFLRFIRKSDLSMFFQCLTPNSSIRFSTLWNPSFIHHPQDVIVVSVRKKIQFSSIHRNHIPIVRQHPMYVYIFTLKTYSKLEYCILATKALSSGFQNRKIIKFNFNNTYGNTVWVRLYCNGEIKSWKIQ